MQGRKASVTFNTTTAIVTFSKKSLYYTQCDHYLRSQPGLQAGPWERSIAKDNTNQLRQINRTERSNFRLVLD